MGTEEEAKKALEGAKAKVAADYASLGDDGGELSGKITLSFESAFDRPPVEEFEMILQRNFSKDEVRMCMFAPKEEQIKYYPALMTAANSVEIDKLGNDHQLKKLKPLLLSLVFLLHRHSWKGFMEEFIVRGGLDIMATMLAEPNLYYRGQVVEIMVTATDSDVFDWFEPKTDIMGRTLHIRLLELSDHPTFLPNLLANRVGSYPGGGMRCLTLLAFWLSWVRAMYTKDQVLQLSPMMVSELKKWGQEPGRDEEGNIDLTDIGDAVDVIEVDGEVSTGDEDGNGDGNEEGGIRDEKKLVKTLLKDFTQQQFKGKEGYSSTGEAARSGSAKADTANVSGIVQPEQDEEVKKKVKEVFGAIDDGKILAFAERSQTDPPSMPSAAAIAAPTDQKKRSASELKAEGNRLFGHGDYLAALTVYNEALSVLSVEEEEELVSVVQFNRAACYWKIVSAVAPHLVRDKSKKQQQAGKGEGEGEGGDAETAQYMALALKQAQGGHSDGTAELAKCEEACRACLAINREHSKAAYRLVAVLLSQGRSSEAATLAESTLRQMEQRQASSDPTYISLLDLRTRCLAACIVDNKGKGKGGGGKEGGTDTAGGRLSGPAAKVLSALQRRRDRERSREVHAEGSAEWKGPPEDKDKDKDKRAGSKKAGAEADVGEYFGASNVYTGGPSSEKTAGKKNSSSSKASAASADTAEEEARKKAKSEARKARHAALAKALSQLRASVNAMERAGFNAAEVDLHKAGVLDALRAVQASKAAAGSSKEGAKYSLAQGFKEGSFLLEEPALVGCLLAFNATSEPPSEWHPLLRQLCACERFGSLLGMSLFGNEALKRALVDLRGKGAGMEGEEEVQRVLSA